MYLSLVIVNHRHLAPVNGILHARYTLRMKVAVVVHPELSPKLIKFPPLFMPTAFSFSSFKLLSQQIVIVPLVVVARRRAG